MFKCTYCDFESEDTDISNEHFNKYHLKSSPNFLFRVPDNYIIKNAYIDKYGKSHLILEKKQ